MALLWFDGFESYNDTNDWYALQPGVFTVSASRAINSNASGRNGRCVASSNANYGFIIDFTNNYTTMIIGMAGYYSSGTPAYHASHPIFEFSDGTTAQVRLHGVGEEIHVYDGAGVKLGETSGCGLTVATWRYIEVKVTIDNSAGVVIIRSDGNVVLNLSGVDTQYSANAQINRLFHRHAFYNNVAGYWDDFYILDTTGDAPHNDFLGDVRVDVLRPNGAGTYTDFTPSAGSNYQNVDEAPGPDDNTTYNQGSSVADQDTYALGGLPSPAGTIIYGSKSQITVRKTDAGSRECKILTRVGTTDDLGDAIVLSDSFTTHTKIFEDNPDDGAAFEDADINGMEVGVEITV